MDWAKIKRHAEQFDQLIDGKLTVADVDQEVSHALAFIMYADASWLASGSKEQRKEMLERVYKPFQSDVADMAKMIIKGEI